jgi:NAD+ diphosphatase
MPGHEATPDQFRSAVEPEEHGLDPASGQPRGYCFAFVESELVVAATGDSSFAVPTWDDLRRWDLDPVRHQYLGSLNGDAYWSAEVPAGTQPPPEASLTGIRALYDHLSEAHYALAGRALQIIAWDRDHQFCGRCGSPTDTVRGERARRCPRCDLIAYPRISPAIIVLIERGERILLARGHAFAPGRFGIIAGFVEPGESLEDAVRREIREEAGIEVTNVAYFGSQPWPFPHGIMIGFHADHLRGEISLDDGELAEADWYDFDELPNVPAKLSIARRLIDDWATRHGKTIDQP